MSEQRTYWHLETLRRVPSEYDIATSRLLYRDPGRDFEVETPAGRWQTKRELESPLRVPDWEGFRDPRETTYASYTALQKDKESFVDTLLRSVEGRGYDQALSPSWLATLGAILPVLRYPCHGLQMVASFLGQVAPASRIVIACLFQTGDEIRRIQRFAHRMRELQTVDPRFGERSKQAWQEDREWQPLRRVIEELLVRYDFGEAFVGLNLVLKPTFDRLVSVGLARMAEMNGDPLLGKLLFSLGEDAAWHRAHARELVRFACAERPENRLLVAEWVARWSPRVEQAARGMAPLFDAHFSETLSEVERETRESWRALGVGGGTA
jgi:toluene monooxygenase system protein E